MSRLGMNFLRALGFMAAAAVAIYSFQNCAPAPQASNSLSSSGADPLLSTATRGGVTAQGGNGHGADGKIFYEMSRCEDSGLPSSIVKVVEHTTLETITDNCTQEPNSAASAWTEEDRAGESLLFVNGRAFSTLSPELLDDAPRPERFFYEYGAHNKVRVLTDPGSARKGENVTYVGFGMTTSRRRLAASELLWSGVKGLFTQARSDYSSGGHKGLIMSVWNQMTGAREKTIKMKSPPHASTVISYLRMLGGNLPPSLVYRTSEVHGKIPRNITFPTRPGDIVVLSMMSGYPPRGDDDYVRFGTATGMERLRGGALMIFVKKVTEPDAFTTQISGTLGEQWGWTGAVFRGN